MQKMLSFVLVLSLGCALSFGCALSWAGPLVYFGANLPTTQFGTLDLGTGSYNVIGPLAGGTVGMSFGAGGALYSETLASSLVKIEPMSASSTTIGSTGGLLAFGGDSARLFAIALQTTSSTTEAFDYYTVNASTGAKSFVGQSLGFSYIPGDGFNGGFSVSSGGSSEYAFFELQDPVSGSFIIAPGLYSIDPGTGLATLVGPTIDDLFVLVSAGGHLYGITDPYLSPSGPSIYQLNTSTGTATFVANVAPPIAHIWGAAVPEPATLALLGLGLAGLGFSRRKQN